MRETRKLRNEKLDDDGSYLIDSVLNLFVCTMIVSHTLIKARNEGGEQHD
jgi:hypothetical protein